MSSSHNNRFEQALKFHQEGQLDLAIPIYEEIRTLHPEEPDVLYLLGTAQLQQGDFANARLHLEERAKMPPEALDVFNNLGIAYKASGYAEKAIEAFQNAVRISPEYGQALFNLGSLFLEEGNAKSAIKILERAANSEPDDVEVWTALANAYSFAKQWDDAEIVWRKICQLQPQQLDCKINLAAVLARQNRFAESAKLCKEVVQEKPNFYQAQNNLSYIYEKMGKLQLAVQAAETALKENSQFAEAWNNLGTARRAQKEITLALEAYSKAIEVSPQFALAKFNYGMTLLLNQQYPEGWAGYESRTDLNANCLSASEKPFWDGSHIPGKTLLIHVDQGLGDTIQFARFLKRLKKISQAKIVFQCQNSLMPLFQKSDGEVIEGVDFLLGDSSSTPEHDFQFSLLSAGEKLQISIEELLPNARYLPAVRSKTSQLESWKQKLDVESKFKVGVVWQGNPDHPRDTFRSIPFSTFQTLFETEGVQFVSLQVDEASRAKMASSHFAETIFDPADCLTDFGKTAELIEMLDLVITVDTSVVHLAGSLGAKTWLLVDSQPDWRWHLECSDSLWYGSVKLFRQTEWGNWESVIESVKKRLETLSAN